DYFKQLFAQVTNPPLDAIREELVTSLVTTIGPEGNLFDETPEQCHQVRLDEPILTNEELAKLKQIGNGALRSRVLPILFERAAGPEGLGRALDALCEEASKAVAEGVTILILSDRSVSSTMAPIP